MVLALRGTTSIEDVITDSVAVPERLQDDFVPKALRAAQGGASAGALYAHAGIRAAADAVLRVRMHGPYGKSLLCVCAEGWQQAAACAHARPAASQVC